MHIQLSQREKGESLSVNRLLCQLPLKLRNIVPTIHLMRERERGRGVEIMVVETKWRDSLLLLPRFLLVLNELVIVMHS